jgi:release factor glutamine methyltransferase
MGRVLNQPSLPGMVMEMDGNADQRVLTLAGGAHALREATPLAEAFLEAVRAPSPPLQSRMMIRHILLTYRGNENVDVTLTEPEAQRLRELLESRVPRSPLDLLRRPLNFGGVQLRTHSAACYTRPDSEQMVDLVVQRLRRRRKGGVIYDVGTGIGSILLACLNRLPATWKGVGYDISLKALVVAGLNQRDLYPGLRAEFQLNDLLDGVALPADAIIAVLPYGTTAALECQPHEVSIEPLSVLHGGGDGLDLVRRIIPQAAALTSHFFLEVAPLQVEPAADLMREAGFSKIEITKDFLGRQRFLLGEKKRPHKK